MALLSLAVLALAAMPFQGPPAAPPAPPQAKKTLFQRVIERPTGQNGYEEYVRAADLLETPEHKAFNSFLWVAVMVPRPLSLGTEKTGEPIAFPTPPLPLTWESTPLQVRQEYVRRFGMAIELVRQGNRKKVWQPREKMGMETVLPELVGFRNLAKLFLEKSKVEFAAGSSTAAVNTLLDGLTFAYKFPDGPIIFPLVSFACQAFILSGFDGCIGRLSIQEARTVIKAVNELLEAQPSLLSAIQRERSQYAPEIVKALEDREHIAVNIGVGPTLEEAIQRLDAGSLRELAIMTKSKLEKQFQDLADVLQGPEADWTKSVPPRGRSVPRNLQSLDQIAEELMTELTVTNGPFLPTLVRTRAQLRVLRTAARVMAYRWTFDKLPDKLEQALPEVELIDPANGGPFQYEVLGPGMFRVYSKGFGDSGPISIRYSRKPETIDDGSFRPPL